MKKENKEKDAVNDLKMRASCTLKLNAIKGLPDTFIPMGIFKEYLEEKKLLDDYKNYIDTRLKSMVEEKLKELTVGEYMYIIEHKELFFPQMEKSKKEKKPKTAEKVEKKTDTKKVKETEKKVETKVEKTDNPKVVWVKNPDIEPKKEKKTKKAVE